MAATAGKKKSASTKRSASTRTPRASTRTGNQTAGSKTSFLSVFHVLKENPLGRFLLLLLAVVLLIGIDFLISFNSMDRFFIAVGIEFILLVLIGWVRFVLRGKAGEDS